MDVQSCVKVFEAFSPPERCNESSVPCRQFSTVAPGSFQEFSNSKEFLALVP